MGHIAKFQVRSNTCFAYKKGSAPSIGAEPFFIMVRCAAISFAKGNQRKVLAKLSRMLFMVGKVVFDKRRHLVDVHAQYDGKLAIDATLCVFKELFVCQRSAVLLVFLLLYANMHRLAYQQKGNKVVGANKLAKMVLNKVRVGVLIIVGL